MRFRMTLAAGAFDARYLVAVSRLPAGRRHLQGAMILLAPLVVLALALAPAPPQPAETVESVVVHGNHTTPTEDVLALVGAGHRAAGHGGAVRGDPRSPGQSGRFAGVDVRKRYLSIDDPTRVLVVIVVDEHEGISEDDLTPGPWKRFGASSMWLPVLQYQEGYGFTYGARLSFVDRLGPRSRISVPLTWGGERQAQLELERTFDGPGRARGRRRRRLPAREPVLRDWRPPPDGVGPRGDARRARGCARVRVDDSPRSASAISTSRSAPSARTSCSTPGATRRCLETPSTRCSVSSVSASTRARWACPSTDNPGLSATAADLRRPRLSRPLPADRAGRPRASRSPPPIRCRRSRRRCSGASPRCAAGTSAARRATTSPRPRRRS